MPSEKTLSKKLDELYKRFNDLADQNESLKKNIAELREEYLETKKEVNYIKKYLNESIEKIYLLSANEGSPLYKEIYRMGEENAKSDAHMGWHLGNIIGYGLTKNYCE